MCFEREREREWITYGIKFSECVLQNLREREREKGVGACVCVWEGGGFRERETDRQTE